MTTDQIGEELAKLREAGEALQQRSAGEVLDALGAVLDAWSGADSAWQAELVESLPGSTGFSADMVREGLATALAGWTGDALRELARRELGAELDASTRARSCSGFPVTAVWLAGSIPMPTLLAMLAPLVLRSAVLAKSASRDPITPHLVARSVAELDAELGRCIRVVDFDHTDDASVRALLQADCLSGTGSDEAIAALRAAAPASCRLVLDGHRLSVAAVALTKRGRVDDIAGRLARDVALWDQLGCLSPIAIYTLGATAKRTDRFSHTLAAALAAAEERWPRGEIEPSAARDVARERAEAELRAAAGRAVTLHASASTAWTVVREDGSEPRPAPLHRFVRVVPVEDASALIAALRPMARHLAAVGLEGFGELTPALARRLAGLGASRLCAVGTLQAPPLDWRHGGRGVLVPLARFTDVETPGYSGVQTANQR